MKEYRTCEVAEATGATLRQLQWWDELGIIYYLTYGGVETPETVLVCEGMC